MEKQYQIWHGGAARIIDASMLESDTIAKVLDYLEEMDDGRLNLYPRPVVVVELELFAGTIEIHRVSWAGSASHFKTWATPKIERT